MNVKVLVFGSDRAVHELELSVSNAVFVTAQVSASPDVANVCGAVNDVL